MERLFRRTVLALAAVVLLVGTAYAQGTTLTILSVDDTHANLHAGGPKDADLQGTLGGIAKVATLVTQERMANPGHVLFVHAGDSFFGDAYFGATIGAAEFGVLKQLGLDAMAVGNHELWLGVPPLLLGYTTAFPNGVGGFPLLCANLSQPIPFVSPHLTLPVGGVTVGVFALTTPYDAITNQNAPGVVIGQDVSELLAIAAGEVDALHGEGAQVVVLLSHLGLTLDRVVAENVPGIDAIMGGHDHWVVAETWNGVPIVHAGAYYRWLGKVTLSVDDSTVSPLSEEVVPVDATVPPLALFATAVSGLQAWVQQTYATDLGPGFFTTPIASAPADLTHEVNMNSAQRDTPVGNLVTDALRWRTGTDVAFTVTGQTPQDLYAGPILPDDLYRIVALGIDSSKPILGWPLATFSLTGAQILQALEGTIDVSLRDDDFIAQVSGMTYTYDSSRAPGERILRATVGDAPIDPAATYTVTANALLFQSLPELFGIVPSNWQILDDHEYTALRDYVERLGHVDDRGGQSRVKDLAPGYARH